MVSGPSNSTTTLSSLNPMQRDRPYSRCPWNHHRWFLILVFGLLVSFQMLYLWIVSPIDRIAWTFKGPTAGNNMKAQDRPNLPATTIMTNKNETFASIRKLVVVTALGEISSLPLVRHNIRHHFAKRDEWDCILFVHANETVLSDSMLATVLTSSSNSSSGSGRNDTTSTLAGNHGHVSNALLSLPPQHQCSLVRLPGALWGHFLIGSLPIELTRPYDYIAVLLDDVFLPNHGSHAINISSLIQQMQEHDISTISPAVVGGDWPATRPQRSSISTATLSSTRECTRRTPMIETFVQIFSRDTFDCWRRQLRHDNSQATCVDLCLTQTCPTAQLAVDDRQVAFHLGTKRLDIPPEALPLWGDETEDEWQQKQRLQLLQHLRTHGARRAKPSKIAMNYELCDKHNCTRDVRLMAQQVASVKALVCR